MSELVATLISIGASVVVVIGWLFFMAELIDRWTGSKRKMRVVQGEQVLHADGNKCPPFIVRKEHHFPVMWCPFCGSEVRDSESVEEVAG